MAKKSTLTTEEMDSLLEDAEEWLPQIPEVEFPEMEVPPATPEKGCATEISPAFRQQLATLGNIDLEVRIELGRTSMLLQDVTRLSRGSVVVLDRHVDEPVHVLINGKVVARGKLIVVDGKFSVQLVEFV